MDPSRCIVLVPVGTYLEPATERGLAELAARGYLVRQVHGYGAVDQARNQLASDALAEGYDELMWIDADMGFSADDVDLLRSHDLPLTCGIGVKKNARALACHLLPDTEKVVFGADGGLLEIRYAGAAFLHTRRELYEAVREHEKLPLCNERFGRPLTPYFAPLIIPDGDGRWYLGEDFAFCERARRSGFAVMADTRVRLDHIGRYAFSWEDAGSERLRYGTYNYMVTR
jgi:hypothetical protein